MRRKTGTKNMYKEHIEKYLKEVSEIAGMLDRDEINKMIGVLKQVRDENKETK